MKAKSLITLIAAALMLASCGSKKVVTEQTTIQQPSSNTQISYVCDMDMKIGVGSDNYNLGGKASLRQNEVVRLNLTYMGFVEVGIIEFTPDYVLVVSRMTKEFCKAGYSLDMLQKNNITFDKVWSMADAELRSSKNQGNNNLGKLVENLINNNMKGGKKVTVNIEFEKPNYKKSFDSKTQLSSKYTQVSTDILMSKLMSVMK